MRPLPQFTAEGFELELTSSFIRYPGRTEKELTSSKLELFKMPLNSSPGRSYSPQLMFETEPGTK